jgi:peptidyl-tRNA hydrolase
LKCREPIDEKLYIVVRADLKPGLQAAQACHALRLFSAEHPEEDRAWYEGSNNLVLLQVPDERELLALREKADGCPASLFREPDLGGEATALAFGPAARKTVSNLPLLLRGA